jgi:hypothetical protein
MSSFVAPVLRQRHVAVWTGTEMIVWGDSGRSIYRFDGGRYTPGTVADSGGVFYDLAGCASPTLRLDDCRIPVHRVTDDNGRALQERVDSCGPDLGNRGQFVKCVGDLVDSLQAQGILTPQESAPITDCLNRHTPR